MFALENPPFYAIAYQVGVVDDAHNALRCLVGMSGIVTNADAQALSADGMDPIPGLYAVDNRQGGRFVGDYPTTIAGASHSIAMTYGRLTGAPVAQL